MSMEISLDLINQLKLTLRKEAKLVNDYSNSSFTTLPTPSEAISELDASAPYLRCRNCKGKLLQGIESLICVFCGEQQRTNDNPPDPIKFTSTYGYKLFLTSLNLDGSEIVEPIKETNESSRRVTNVTPVVKGVAVSEFLDLDIHWSAREDNKSVENRNHLNLGGINLDDYFVEGRGEFSKVDSMEDEFKDPRSLSLFDSVKISQGVVESKKDENVDLFKGKEVQKDENLSLFAGRDVKDNVSLFEGKDVERNSSFKGDENLSLFEATTPLTNDKVVVGSSTDWDSEFQSADHRRGSEERISEDPFVSSPVDLSAHMDSVFGSGKNLLYADSSSTVVSKVGGDWLQDDLFGSASAKTQNKDDEGEVVGENRSSSMDIDWIGDDLWKTNEKKHVEKNGMDVNDDDWNDFAGSSNSKTPNVLLSQTMTSSQDEKQNSGASVISDMAKGQEDDLFGTWDSFTPSTVQPATNHVDSSCDQDSETNLFSTNNKQRDLDFDNIVEVKAMPSEDTRVLFDKSKNDVAEELISQMHDLSFMLETKLSVPPSSKKE